DWSLERLLPSRVRSTAYAFAFNEGYLLTLVRKLVLQPLLGLGSFLHRLDGKGGRAVGAGVAFGLILASRLAGTIPDLWLAIPTAALMAAASMSALSETQKALRAWNAVGFSCFFAGVAI